MLCENCGKRPATVHYTQIINGVKTEMHLCEVCAKQKGNLEFDAPFSVTNFLAGILEPAFGTQVLKPSFEIALTCKGCGMTFDEFRRAGRFGCAMCYSSFSEKLYPIFRRIHGNTKHVGKIPTKMGGDIAIKREIDRLKIELNVAIKNEEYEKAAKIRDKIRELEKKLSRE
ncbi:UvrB/UvrC motif-containing protein [Anaerocellum danielii]|uniref:UvrB/UvrC motif-containing protein n=1 Tax=Anaerocellum danielii TaxID=1387557 RepID=A0ABZ0TX21_9FIRM|nr:UvrB/UvrC motif-containing protein [Caldicellulosiruptor danielii]WPX07977.1 UvrB/UvrC motif-containing protein [Caldicellulosiruptor danielii]